MAQGKLSVDDPRVVKTTAGDHIIQAVSEDGKLNWTGTVTADPSAQKMVKIALSDLLPTWTDPATGLMWTKKDNGSNVDWNQAVAFCQNLSLGGYSGWRLPTTDELEAIYDPSVEIPGHWPNGQAATWHVKGNLMLSSGWQWTSSGGRPSGKAWYFSFGTGDRLAHQLGSGDFRRALCVRDSVAVNSSEKKLVKILPSDMSSNWTDPETGLMWTSKDNGSDVNWNRASAYCQNLSLGGYSDWRMPTIDELQAIYEPKESDQGWHIKGNLKLTGGFLIWSSSRGSASGEAWIFDFLPYTDDDGRSSSQLGLSMTRRALCVHRSGN